MPPYTRDVSHLKGTVYSTLTWCMRPEIASTKYAWGRVHGSTLPYFFLERNNLWEVLAIRVDIRK